MAMSEVRGGYGAGYGAGYGCGENVAPVGPVGWGGLGYETGVILVLFILLVIISRTFLGF